VYYFKAIIKTDPSDFLLLLKLQSSESDANNWLPMPCLPPLGPIPLSFISISIFSSVLKYIASGTSMASPHVAGVAAIYLGATAGTTPSSVWNAINAASSLGKVTSVPPKTFNKLLCIVGCTKA